MSETQQEAAAQTDPRVPMLKSRAKRCVCKYCGGRLRLRRIIFSSYEEARVEMFCNSCDRIEFGVEPEIYQSARFFVENSRFNAFPDLDDNERTKQMTIAKVCEIMTWQDQNLGFINDDGFVVPLNRNENFIGECITLSDKDLPEDDEVIQEKYSLE